SNIWVALGGALLAAETFALSNQCFNGLVILQMFAASFVVYNLQRLVKSKQYAVHSQAATFTEKNKSALLLAIAVCCLFLLFSPWPVTADLLILGFSLLVASALYVLRIFPAKGKLKSLREFPVVKIFVVTAVWAVATTVLPPLLSNSSMPNGCVAMVLERWFYFMAITIPFDIRDMLVDDPSNKTIPQLVGAKMARNIACTFILAMVGANVFRLNAGWLSITSFVSLFFVAVLSLWLIKKSKPGTDNMLFAGWLDGTMFLRGVLVLLAVVSEVQGFFEC
ncbi:MAG: hypothetical protein NWR73_09840, partial [Flavobacteriales bacterium]|nr:hypothetical protein [Flavobacteriales bacterium]